MTIFFLLLFFFYFQATFVCPVGELHRCDLHAPTDRRDRRHSLAVPPWHPDGRPRGVHGREVQAGAGASTQEAPRGGDRQGAVILD